MPLAGIKRADTLDIVELFYKGIYLDFYAEGFSFLNVFIVLCNFRITQDKSANITFLEFFTSKDFANQPSHSAFWAIFFETIHCLPFIIKHDKILSC